MSPPCLDYINSVDEIHGNGGKAILGLGNLDSADETFHRLVSLNDDELTEFAVKTRAFLTERRFDGIDVFWFLPTIWKADFDGPRDDRENFTRLLKV